MSIVLKQKQKSLWGVTISMPNVGKQTPSAEDGTFTIENDEHAHSLVLDNIGVVYAEESLNAEIIPPVVEKDEDNEDEEKEEKEEKKEVEKEKAEFTPDEIAALKEAYVGQTVAELTTLCKDNNFPGGEWRGKNKEALADYLISKL